MLQQLIQIEVSLYDSIARMEQAIENELSKQGHPLSWIVFHVDKESKKVYVEALILTTS